MTEADLKVGMYLINDGTKSVPVYGNPTATGTPVFYVKPKGTIGQIVSFENGADGYIVLVTSDEISSHENYFQKAAVFLSKLAPIPTLKIAGSIRFNDLKNNLSDSQVAKQNQAIVLASQNGVNINSMFEKASSAVSTAVTSLIPWNLVFLAAGVYVAVNWNKFYTPKKT